MPAPHVYAGHPAYNKYVETLINRIDPTNMTPADASNTLMGLSDQMRKLIQSNGWTKLK